MPAYKARCPKCQHQWQGETISSEGFVACPACGVKLHFQARKAEPPSRDSHSQATLPPESGAQSATHSPRPAPSEPTTPLPSPDEPTSQIPAAAPSKASPEEATGALPQAPASASATSAMQQTAEDVRHLVGTSLGGYRIEKLLGIGGMGAVFLARQVSLDRDVALKVLPPRMAKAPSALSRFMREALSAAQMTHHNVVQVYDVGSDRGEHYISMEYVRGRTLADIIRSEGRLTVDDTAGYALQAARGLHYAHQRGIVHRDIKPDNLMVNEQGIVKIADMGLAKMIGADAAQEEARGSQDLSQAQADLTLAQRGMGTPSYMPPEQARDARSVDARADQYSLGCTMYYLCAGRAPYTGATAHEVITKHIKEPVTPLDTHIQNVPAPFQTIIGRMLQKDPEDRYPDMASVVADLEEFLGVSGEKGEYRPREHHLAALDASRAQFYSAGLARARSLAPAAFFGLCGLLFLVSFFAGGYLLAGAAIGLAILAPAVYFIVDGIATRGYFFRRVRSLFFAMSARSWLIVSGLAVGLPLTLYALGLLWLWLGVGVVAVGLAAAYEFGVMRRLRSERSAPLDKMRQVLRELRLKGLSEEALQQFVRRFSSGHWEEFFEALFGYEAMVRARERWAPADAGARKRRYAPWREPLARWLDSVEAARKRARERRQVARLEAQRLKAEGMEARKAEEAARKEAEDFERAVSQTDARARQEERRQAEDSARPEEAKKGGKTQAHPESQYVDLPVRRSSWPGRLYRLGRLMLGLILLALWAARQGGFGAPVPSILGRLAERVAGWGWHPIMLGIAGALVALSALRRSIFPPLFMIAGACLALGYKILVPLIDQPRFTDPVAFWGGLALLAGGFLYMMLDMLAGRKR